MAIIHYFLSKWLELADLAVQILLGTVYEEEILFFVHLTTNLLLIIFI